jgi:hypothetical protein
MRLQDRDALRRRRELRSDNPAQRTNRRNGSKSSRMHSDRSMQFKFLENKAGNVRTSRVPVSGHSIFKYLAYLSTLNTASVRNHDIATIQLPASAIAYLRCRNSMQMSRYWPVNDVCPLCDNVIRRDVGRGRLQKPRPPREGHRVNNRDEATTAHSPSLNNECCG